MGADWRQDKRILDTGNPVTPEYPRVDAARDLGHDCHGRHGHRPAARAGARAPAGVAHRFRGGGYTDQPEIPDWLAQQGRMIEDADIEEIADRDAEVALLASEFSDFEDFAAPSDAAAEPDDGFAGDF